MREAHERAILTNAQLAVCHIIPNELRSNVLFPQISRIAALQLSLATKHIAEAALARVTEITGRSSAEFELMVDDGKPQALISRYAEEWLADVVIMGSHGQTSAADVLLGSVTDSVIRHAHCPVLIARRRQHTRHIIAGTDFSDPALPAIKAGADEAGRVGGDLTLVHSLDLVWSAAAYPGMEPFNLSQAQIDELELIATRRLEDCLKQLNITGHTLITSGPAGAALVQVASELNVDLIVVGTVGRTGIRRALLGSVAETVAKEAPCSVLIVRQHLA